MDINLIRHGQTYDNILGIFGKDETSLTEVGKNQIEESKKNLKKIKFDKVYCSPLKRTMETLEVLDLDGELENRLKEYNFGIFTGLTYEEINKLYPKETKLWIEDPINYKIPEGDSLSELYLELEMFLSELINKDEDVLLIAHAGIIQLALTWVFDNVDYFYRFKVDNGSITTITVESDYKFISRLNYI